jgi:hypothetical protein
MSYARSDDLVPPNRAGAKGFVTFLYEQLQYEFTELGAVPALEVWRDVRKIARGDQFDPIIEDAIKASELFLAVLSPNWMLSENCKEELESFCQRWQHEDEMRVRQRIIVACKKPVARPTRPSLMQGQEGYSFFAYEGPKNTGAEIPYFNRGEICDDRYEDVVQELAEFLNNRVRHVTRVPGDPPGPRPPTLPRPLPVAQPDARKIYLAKPASDMLEAYRRLVEELAHNGYAVVPDPNANIPNDASAWEFIDSALSSADISIHLLGKIGGFSPEAPNDSVKPLPIVQLQLARAALRSPGASEQSNGSGKEFRRIIWAPETPEDSVDPSAANGNGNAADDGTAAAVAHTVRRPNEVLRLFGDFEPATDKVVGGTLSKFVDFLISHLRQSVQQVRGRVEPVTPDDWVYVYHTAEDTDYACNLMTAFQQRGVAFRPPALEGDPTEVTNIHKKRLSECSAIVLCWANATEAWAHARADELQDWETLGRERKFKYRGLLAGPPPGRGKTVFVKFPPANEIDVVVNQIEDTRPLAEIIDKFIRPAAQDAP